MGQDTPKRSYKDTLNLPQTAFAMKANLVQNEPASLKRWEQEKLYQRIRAARAGAPKFIFHDGPPYANGSIHLGHLLNKVLKDFVVRSRTMMGLDCPYVPGWDCHGQPIEHRVVETLPDKGRGMAPMQVRVRCADYAKKFIKLQSQQMRRLLTLADYERPYLTMTPDYEAAVLEVFAELVGKGLVYRDLKPVHWSIENRTALAEAELEYYDRQDTSVYVLFEVTNPAALAAVGLATPDGPVHLMIWTTTPWTLPANLAVAVAAHADYGLYRVVVGTTTCHVIVACDLADKVFATRSARFESLGSVKGGELVGLQYRHPFIDRVSPVLTAEHVTLEDGTGLVHTAPGHGKEDYDLAKKAGVDIYCPVKDDGTFDDTAPDWLRGQSAWDANTLVVERLRGSGHLFHDHTFTHSYPHDWRGKTPTIFRATEQWFIAVDSTSGGSLRELAMQTTQSDVRFIPDWGRNRMRGMLESRPDWCISRQRHWGLPIPAFFPPEGVEGEPLLTKASVLAVSRVLRAHGSDAWFKLPPEELLKGYDPAADPDAPVWIKITNHKSQITKSHDIFDVWFESGSSWHAVMRQRNLGFPADLYLEGSDQHRGWFQLSLLPALGVTGQSPFKTVLTHGFMVDKDGRKMSKSLGNTLEVEDLLKEFGADVCRWWVASLNTENDIKVDHEFFKLAGEEYRKVRNTIKYLLSNLYDFDPRKDAHVFAERDATSLDAWALDQLSTLVTSARRDYEAFHFRGVREALFNFCNETMSATYLAATKDRLYCDPPGSPRRRRTQTAMHTIADALIRLLAPLLPHTADEAWRALNGDGGESVHVAVFPEAPRVKVDRGWAAVMARRDTWLKALEDFRQSTGVDNPLDLGLSDAPLPEAAKFDPIDLADLCGISRFSCGQTLTVTDLRSEPRCERSWKRDGTVKQRSTASGGDGGMLCDRCAAAIGV